MSEQRDSLRLNELEKENSLLRHEIDYLRKVNARLLKAFNAAFKEEDTKQIRTEDI